MPCGLAKAPMPHEPRCRPSRIEYDDRRVLALEDVDTVLRVGGDGAGVAERFTCRELAEVLDEPIAILARADRRHGYDLLNAGITSCVKSLRLSRSLSGLMRPPEFGTPAQLIARLTKLRNQLGRRAERHL